MAGIASSLTQGTILLSWMRCSRVLQVEVGADEDDLPLTYEPARIAEFWSRRPVAVLTRVAQLLSIGGGFLTGVLWDLANGSFGKNEVGPTSSLQPLCRSSLQPAVLLGLCGSHLACFAVLQLDAHHWDGHCAGEEGDPAAKHRDEPGPSLHQGVLKACHICLLSSSLTSLAVAVQLSVCPVPCAQHQVMTMHAGEAVHACSWGKRCPSGRTSCLQQP